MAIDLRSFYDTNADFHQYMDKFLANNPDISFDLAIQHVIIKEIANYYATAPKAGV